jgi:hypothetical protein
MITGIISLSVTVLSTVGGCLCGLLVVGVVLGMIGGVVAIIMGFMARSRVPGSGGGLTGILTGFGTLLIGLVFIVLLAIGVAWVVNNQPPPGGGPGMGQPGGFNNNKRF